MIDEDDESTVRSTTGPAVSTKGTEPHLILLQGASIGRVFRLSGASYDIGRSLRADIQLEDDGVSRMHARIERDSTGALILTDLESTNGSFVNRERIRSALLKDGDVIQFGKNVVLKYTLQSAVENTYAERLYEAATRDPLTGLLNRRFFDDQIGKDLAHAARHGVSLSVLLLDLDHFKHVNDTHGHPAGDQILSGIGALIRNCTRSEDVACRLGGEEFAVLMRTTDWHGVQQMGERLRAQIEHDPIEIDGVQVPITASVGVATFDGERHQDAASLLEEADQALYRAKHGGRNQVKAGPRPTRSGVPQDASASSAGDSGPPPPADMKTTLT